MNFSTIDPYTQAEHMIEHYGDDAEVESIFSADSCLENGDIEGSLVWAQVTALVSEIEGEKMSA